MSSTHNALLKRCPLFLFQGVGSPCLVGKVPTLVPCFRPFLNRLWTHKMSKPLAESRPAPVAKSMKSTIYIKFSLTQLCYEWRSHAKKVPLTIFTEISIKSGGCLVCASLCRQQTPSQACLQQTDVWEDLNICITLFCIGFTFISAEMLTDEA